MLTLATRLCVRKTQRTSFSTSVAARSSVGIVGLPNVGKSCLFNALLGREASQSSNYPFCTINPTSGKTVYRDPRLIKLARVIKPKRVSPIAVEFVDIAGLVEGASDGMGLGNQFLENIRSVSAILHLVRCFPTKGSTVTHVMDTIDPIRDINIIENELRLKDIQTLSSMKKLKKGNNFKWDIKAYGNLLEKVQKELESGAQARNLQINPSHSDYEMFSSFRLLSSKPVLYVCNVDEASAATGNEYSKALIEYVQENRPQSCHVALSAILEFELATLESPEQRDEFMKIYGLTEVGIEKLISESFKLLGLQTFYTMGQTEVRAWTVPFGSTAKQCAGKIHTDFEKGFIKAEMWTVDDVLNSKDGKYKRQTRGADYVMQDGDCFEFKVRA